MFRGRCSRTISIRAVLADLGLLPRNLRTSVVVEGRHASDRPVELLAPLQGGHGMCSGSTRDEDRQEDRRMHVCRLAVRMEAVTGYKVEDS